jgi:hypothetical protein
VLLLDAVARRAVLRVVTGVCDRGATVVSFGAAACMRNAIEEDV